MTNTLKLTSFLIGLIFFFSLQSFGKIYKPDAQKPLFIDGKNRFYLSMKEKPKVQLYDDYCTTTFGKDWVARLSKDCTNRFDGCENFDKYGFECANLFEAKMPEVHLKCCHLWSTDRVRQFL